jgi:hypothetical protein
MAKPFQRIMQYIGQHGIVRPRDIEAIGLPREYLVRLHRKGKPLHEGAVTREKGRNTAASVRARLLALAQSKGEGYQPCSLEFSVPPILFL